jgi:6,7-dimethyl-8-ribityllumazine synthase
MQVFEGRVCQPPMGGNITILVARFNKTITQRLLDGAIAKLRQHNVHEDDIRVVWVPGAYELPYIADHFAKDPDCMAIICLGAVIKGETSHDQHINRYVSMALGETASRYNKPIIFGVITCDTIEQANARSGIVESAKDKTRNPAPGNKGAEAAEAALEMIDLIEEIPDYQLAFSPQEILSRLMGGGDDDDDDDWDDDDDDECGNYDMPFFPPFSPKKGAKGTKKGKKK